MIIEQVQDEQSAKLLATANLLRIRRQWDEAVTCCMQVLYHSPDNWSAHALIGDIYADQDRPEEAIQWYCMTLDIRPDSQSVREKLSKVVNNRRRQIVHSIDPTRPYTNRYGRTFPSGKLGKLAWYWSAPERKRLIVVAAVIIVVFAICAAPSLLANHANHSASAAVFTEGSTPTNTGVVFQPVPTAVKITDPIAPAPLATPLNSVSQPDLNPPATAPVAPATAPIRDPNDESITESLQNDSGLHGQGIEVTDAQMQPAVNSMTVTFVSTGPPSPTQQAREMRDAMYVARTALNTSPAAGAGTCTVRCLAQQPVQPATGSMGAAAEPAQAAALSFTGTISRDALSTENGDLTGLTAAQLNGFFTDVWWLPSPTPSP
jgi:hypothetical protein